MRIALLTVLRNDMLEHFKVAREYGMEIDILTTGREPAHERAYIPANNLTERVYGDEAGLFRALPEYDVISAYEFGGPVQRKIMGQFDNFVPECAWNVPSYGTYWGFPGGETYRPCLALAKQKVRAFIARSQSVYDCLVQEGIPEERIHLVWGVCNTDRFRPRPKPERFEGKLVFLFIGRGQEQKGIFEVFHAFHRANIPDSVLVYVGGAHPTNPWAMDAIKEWASILGYGNRVEFHGWVTEPEVHRCYNWGDVFISVPNTSTKFVEQVGLTVPQALASGLPVITNDFGGQAGFVDGTCGFKIHHKDYVAAAEAMRKLADVDLRRTLSEAARRRAVERYDVHNYAQGIKVAYERGVG